jgi:hypothetical protein
MTLESEEAPHLGDHLTEQQTSFWDCNGSLDKQFGTLPAQLWQGNAEPVEVPIWDRIVQLHLRGLVWIKRR